jgi:hypothetical protein
MFAVSHSARDLRRAEDKDKKVPTNVVDRNVRRLRTSQDR